MGQNVIELNGKRYDAVTGAYLGKSHVIPQHIIDRHVHGKVIDGFVRPSNTTVRKPEPPKREAPAHAQAGQQPKPKLISDQVKVTGPHLHATASHVRPHQPEKSRTLVRRVVKKPEFALKPAIKPQAPAEIMTKPKSTLMHKPSAYGVDPARRERAAVVNKHHSVRHFLPHGRTPAIHAVSSEVPRIDVRPMPLQVAGASIKSVHHADIFEKAIATASSHLEPKHKVRRSRSKGRRIVNSLAIVAAFLVIGGFISYLNLPQLEMRVASVQAGFGASVPSYAPTGYALEGRVKHVGGTVSLSFRSGDSRYTLTQQSSNWNSQTLLDNTLALNGEHQTVQRNGQTIYIYGNGANASWVNGGVRYDITGNAQLSKDEIASIATSL